MHFVALGIALYIGKRALMPNDARLTETLHGLRARYVVRVDHASGVRQG